MVNLTKKEKRLYKRNGLDPEIVMGWDILFNDDDEYSEVEVDDDSYIPS